MSTVKSTEAMKRRLCVLEPVYTTVERCLSVLFPPYRAGFLCSPSGLGQKSSWSGREKPRPSGIPRYEYRFLQRKRLPESLLRAAFCIFILIFIFHWWIFTINRSFVCFIPVIFDFPAKYANIYSLFPGKVLTKRNGRGKVSASLKRKSFPLLQQGNSKKI